ncbi:MAG: DNA polymerase III subunit alpha [bacterium]
MSSFLSFAHLSVRSHYSFLRGGSSPEELCCQAAREGVRSLALTDVNGLYGAVPFLRAAEAEGIRPIFGVDLREPIPGRAGRTREENESPRSRRGFVEDLRRGPAGRHVPRRAILLVKGQDGYPVVNQIVTSRHLDHDFNLLRALTGRGEGAAVLTSDLDLLEALVAVRGPEDHHLALPSWGPWRRLYGKARDRGLLDAGVEPVAAGEVWFARPWDRWKHHLLTAVGLNTSLSGVPPSLLAPGEAWLQGPGHMLEVFRDLPEAVRNAAELAEACSGGPRLGTLHLPRSPLTDRPALGHLREQCLRGIVWRYGTRDRPRATSGQICPSDDPRCPAPGQDTDLPVPDPALLREEVTRQLEHELGIIAEMGYADYFLVVADIVRFARAEGIPTCGRGSAANSVVAYTLGLTHVDPLAHDLYFERFLNQGRRDAPDVDLDFSWRDRDRVLAYVYERYGPDRVAMIATQVTFQARAAVREVARAHGLPEGEIAEVSRRLGRFGDARELREKIDASPRFRGIDLTEEPWRSVLEAAEHLDGVPRHLGLHPGGILIAPGPLTDHLPLERTAKGLVATQWDMYPVEDAGLVKIDLLGNRSLAVIDDACSEVERLHGHSISYAHFDPTEDAETRALLQRGDTVGCFYVESPAMRGLLQKLGCDDFEGLVAASSIIRPGVSSSGMMHAYIARCHGEPFSYLHPKMEDLLGSTYGVMCYQEDVIKVAHHIAGLSLADADGLRKSMSRKRDHERIEGYRQQFLEGAAEQGTDPAVAEELWRQVESFGGYSFCKAHSASYALVSFQAVWLRAHYPGEFMAAVLSNRGGFYTTFAYISEAVRMGLQLRGPDVNASREVYTGYTFDEGEGREGYRGWLRIGLCQVGGLSGEGCRALVAERERGGRYTGFDDLVRRVPLTPGELEALIRCGALDGLEEGTRPELMWRALVRERRRVPCRGREARGDPLRLPLEMPVPREPPPTPEYDPLTLLGLEAETLGCLVSTHPLALCRDAVEEERGRRGPPFIRGEELADRAGERVRLAGWMVTAKPVHTVHDEVMEFISFEDATALYEVTVFPAVYRRYASRLLTRGPFVLTGRVEEEWGAVSLTLERLRVLGGEKCPGPINGETHPLVPGPTRQGGYPARAPRTTETELTHRSPGCWKAPARKGRGLPLSGTGIRLASSRKKLPARAPPPIGPARPRFSDPPDDGRQC